MESIPRRESRRTAKESSPAVDQEIASTAVLQAAASDVDNAVQTDRDEANLSEGPAILESETSSEDNPLPDASVAAEEIATETFGALIAEDEAAVNHAEPLLAAGAADVLGDLAGPRVLVGHIDVANGAQIKGWVWDPQAPRDRIRLEVMEGETQVLVAVADESRPGLIAAGVSDGQHAFSISLADAGLSDGPHLLHLRCAATGAPLPGSPIVVERAEPIPMALAASFDLGMAASAEREAPAPRPNSRFSDDKTAPGSEKGAVRAAGALPQRTTAGDEAGLAAARLSQPGQRPAVPAPGASAAPVAGPNGKALDDRKTLDDRPSADRTPALEYHLDEISDKEIAGWVTVPSRPNYHCTVALKEGERVLGRAIASRFRLDLLEAGIGDGCCCFSLPMPRSLLDGDEHELEIIEQETGTPLSPEPIRWRSGAGTSPNALAVKLDQPAIDRAEDAIHQGAGVGRLPTLVRQDHGRRSRVTSEIGVPGAAAGGHAGLAASVRTRLLFDVSDLVYYIGHHPNLTGIQRVQSSIVLAIVASGTIPASHLSFLSFNARLRRWMVIPTGFLISLLRDLFQPPRQRLVTFPADEARYGSLPGATEFDGTGVLDDGNPSVFCLLGAAWVQRDYLHRILGSSGALAPASS